MKYPDWLTAAIVKAYQDKISVEEIAEIINYPPASIRWKLVKEGVYLSKRTKKNALPEFNRESMGF